MTSSQGLRPAKLLRVASLVRSSPLISATFSFNPALRCRFNEQHAFRPLSYRRPQGRVLMITRRGVLEAGGALALTAADSVPAWSGDAGEEPGEALLSPLLPGETRAEAVLDY